MSTNHITRVLKALLNGINPNLAIDDVTRYFLKKDADMFDILFDLHPDYVEGNAFTQVNRQYKNILQEFVIERKQSLSVFDKNMIIREYIKNAYTNRDVVRGSQEWISASKKIDTLFFLNKLFEVGVNNKIGYPYKMSFSLIYNSGRTIQSESFLIQNRRDLINMIFSQYNAIFNSLEVLNKESMYQEDGEEDDSNWTPIQKKFRYLINSIHVSISNFQNRKLNGRFWPDTFNKFVTLPPIIAPRVINPLNSNKFCLFYCIHMSKFYDARFSNLSMYWTKHGDTLHEIIEKEKEKYEQFYDAENKFVFSVRNMKQIENLMNINIHIYSLDGEDLVCRFRSEFRQENKNVIRVLYIPYKSMRFLAAADRSKAKKIKLSMTYQIGEGVVEEDDRDHEDESEFLSLQKNNHGHFTLIANPKSFFNCGTNSYDVCRFCDNVFCEIGEHEKICEVFMKNNFSSSDRSTMLKPNEPCASISFKDHFMKTKMGFLIYGDTETVSVEGVHRLINYKLYAHCSFDKKLSKSVMYTAENEEDMQNIHKKFMKDLLELRVYCTEKSNRKRIIIEWEKNVFLSKYNDKKDTCDWCGENFDAVVRKYRVKKNMDGMVQGTVHRKVLHHDHNTGEIIGYICHSCNMIEKKCHQISICFHNLPFDLLVLLESFAETNFSYDGKDYIVDNTFNILAKSSQKYSSMRVASILRKKGDEENKKETIYLYPLKFIDSYAFIRAGLDRIIKNMITGKNRSEIRNILPITFDYFSKKYNENFFDECCYNKGALAYDKINVNTLKNTKNFEESEYKSTLGINFDEYTGDDAFSMEMKEKAKKNEDNNKKYYEQSQKTWDLLSQHYENMTMKVYFEFYLELDVYLMADYFESIRNNCFLTHKLDIAYCQGLASYSQKSYLNYTKKTLHLIQDLNLCQLLIENMRGGFSGVLNKTSDNSEENPKKMIWYLDVNNLYGYSMVQKLANRFLEELEYNEEIEKEMGENKDENFAYFCLIDYNVPEKIHDKLSKLPPLISKKTIENKDVSSYNKSIKFCETGKDLISAYRSTKLCATLENGENYLCDYENLLLYRELGYEITVKKVYKFEAEYLMKDYIDMNTKLRQQNSDNELLKQFYKDLNNIIYGKNLENPLGYKNFELFDGKSESLVQKRVNSPLYKNHKIIVDDELVIIESNKKSVQFSTNLQTGFHILEKSKLKMYGSLYRNFIPFFEENNIKWKILMHDTDSFCFELDLEGSSFENEKEMMMNAKNNEFTKNLFDLHMYEDKDIKDNSRKKAVGYFLDEFSDSNRIISFIGLCAKSYTYLNKNIKTGEITQEIKGKGVPQSYLEDLFTFDKYKLLTEEKTLKNNEISYTSLQKRNFNNVMKAQTKKILSLFDDKFYFYEKDGKISMYPYGHYKIKELREEEEKIIEETE